MIDIVLDGILDVLKLLPFLFVTFLILEFVEHKISKKSLESLSRHKKIGPILGGIFGGFPQCGFSAMASNLYAGKIITMGTLVAIFLSTSDEMVAVMVGENVPATLIFGIIGVKILVGIIVGLIVDFASGSKIEGDGIKNMCEEEHCHCKNGIFLSSVLHTLKTGVFVLIFNLLVGFCIYFVGEETLSSFLNADNVFVYFVASLIGLIPNCAASVVLTEAYISGVVPIGVAMAGLLSGSGVGMLLLFKNNKNKKENFIILEVVCLAGVVFGVLTDLASSMI